MKEVKIIKRYRNRKLYDTDKSVYVTLEEISKMIRAHQELRIIDNNTNLDITAMTLTQLLYESERKTKSYAPIDILTEIIQQGDGSFSSYIQAKMITQQHELKTESPSLESNRINSEMNLIAN